MDLLCLTFASQRRATRQGKRLRLSRTTLLIPCNEQTQFLSKRKGKRRKKKMKLHDKEKQNKIKYKQSKVK